MLAFRLLITALFISATRPFTHVSAPSAHHYVGGHRMQLLDVNDNDESSFFNVDRAREIAKLDTECSMEELQQLQNCIHLYDAQNRVYGWCSEHEMNLECLEHAIQEKLERMKAQSTDQDAPVECVSAKSRPTTPKTMHTRHTPKSIRALQMDMEKAVKTNNKHAPKSIRALQLDIEKAALCAVTGRWPSNLDDLEEMEDSLHIMDAEQRIYGLADFEDAKFQMIEHAIEKEMQKRMVQARTRLHYFA
mmetsp:Transcript_14920/g.28490  ORF Transcript_14920/g.28490 Transcript_14920/m.28490 type:complete len:248 (+) Transcript_14920:363-1106(+)